MARYIPLFYRGSMGAVSDGQPVSKAPRPGEAAADGHTAPSSRPSAAAALADLAGARERIARSLELRHPHWRVWWHSRWYARRKGNFEALAEGSPYLLTAPGRHELSVLLVLEDGREPRGSWKR
jgi:hypothetical protein